MPYHQLFMAVLMRMHRWLMEVHAAAFVATPCMVDAVSGWTFPCVWCLEVVVCGL
jgi:hypothetical protein